ncbi:MAG TPA: hypothetical protein G4O02_13185 [Caldilineae bacterium]|nr:hypothetical protein [Caldilineae bacterium]
MRSAIVLALVGFAYAALPWPWAMVPLLVLGWLIAHAPGPGLALIALTVPFYYSRKPLDSGWLSYTEAFTISALVWSFPRWCYLRGRWRALDGAVLAFVLVGGAAALVAPDREGAWSALGRLILAPAGLYMLWRLLPVNRQTAYWAAGGLVAGGMLVSVIGIAGYIGGDVVVAGRVPRLRSMYYSPNEAALFFTRVWPMSMAFALGTAGRSRRLFSLATGVILIALALTFSRGAWLLGMPAGLAALALTRRRWRIGPWVPGAMLLAALVALIRGDGAALRPEVWRAAWAMWRDHPWLGVGLDGFQWVYPRYMALSAWREPLLYHPHNAVLEIGTWMGGLGLLAVIAMGWAWTRIYRHVEHDASPALLSGLAAGWIAGLAHGMVDAFIVLPHLALWAMMALGMITVYDTSSEDEAS